MQKAMEYFERSVAIEPQATTLEQMGQIRLKKGDAKEAAVAVRARHRPAQDRDASRRSIWRAKLRRDLADAYEVAGDAGAAETHAQGRRSPTGTALGQHGAL